MSATFVFLESLRHERRLFGAERLQLIVALILLAAIGYAIGNGHAWVTHRQQAVAMASAEEQGRQQANRAALAAIQAGTLKAPSVFRDPSNPFWVGNRLAATHAVLPPTALAATAVGQSDLNPPFVTVSADGKETFAFDDEIENPANLLVGHFDLAFVVIFMLPLVIIALTYNLLSAEREQGTLALCLANPVPLGTLLLGKLIFRAGLVLAPTVAIAIAGLGIAGTPLFSADGVLRFAAWALLVIAYGGFWFAVAAAVNVLGKGSAQNALMLAALWLVFLLVLPTLGSISANLAYPLPSRAEMVNTLRTVQTDARKEADASVARYQQEHPGEAGGQADAEQSRQRAALLQAAAAKATQVMALHDEQRLRQQHFVAVWRFLSPAILMQDALNDVAGTGEGRYRHYRAQVDRFSQQWRDFFAPKVQRNESLTVADYDRFPRFRYAEQGLGEWAVDLPAALLGLLLPAAVLAAFSARRVRGYSVG